jgi:hypothetical protein
MKVRKAGIFALYLDYNMYFCEKKIMTNKKKNQVQHLSPEKYIRQKSRNLPIYKCLIHEKWEELRFSLIVIARQHAGGNLTVCTYLTDWFCLGVKETQYFFNISPLKFEEFQYQNSIEVPYSLVHNIIYAAIEFAEEYGFAPHKDFTQTTCYFLEEDTDDIPLIDIPCGGVKDGKPYYINTGTETLAQSKQIIDQLEKTAGEGNYNYILPPNLADDYWEEQQAAIEEERYKTIRELRQIPHEEQIDLFFKLYKERAEDTIAAADNIRLVTVMNILVAEMIDEEEVEKQRKILKYNFGHPIVDLDTFPNNLFLGIQDDALEIAPDLFEKTYRAIEENENALQAIETFREKVGDVPVVGYLELLYWKIADLDKYIQLMAEYYAKYPDYFLVRMAKTVEQAQKEQDITELKLIRNRYETLLLDLIYPLTDHEWNVYIAHYPVILNRSKTDEESKEFMTKIHVLKEYINTTQITADNIVENLWSYISYLQMEALIFLLRKEE